MLIAEVVETADNIHASSQGGGLANKRASTASKRSQPLTEGGVEALDQSSIDDATTLRAFDQLCHQHFTTLDNAPFNTNP